MFKGKKGQASLDYLLVLCAFIAMGALIFPAMQNLTSVSLFAMEVKNAANFSDSLIAKINSINEFGEGSCFELCVNPNSKWSLTKEEEKLIVRIRKDNLKKDFERTILDNVHINKILFDSPSCIYIIKKEKEILVTNSEC